MIDYLMRFLLFTNKFVVSHQQGCIHNFITTKQVNKLINKL